MAMSVGSESGDSSMVDINTTPLIDVMLVLLIMFIITIPIQTHAVKIDLPVDNKNQPPPEVDPVVNNVEIDFLNQVYWNRQPVSMEQLRSYFSQAANMQPEPELRLRPDPLARYEVVNEVMASAQRSGVTKMGFVGNENYAQ
ncbi:MAG: ExbD/TolR family protein [Sphingomonadaceae bacterium]